MTKIQSYGIIAGVIGVALIALGMYIINPLAGQLPSVMNAPHFGAKSWCVALGVFTIAGGAILGVFGRRRT
jgi:tetrahydromethanopterin S-methyltransferase subunit C